ncbi:MAG: adenine phosphoribosyltransferase [Candidatus Zixiibacteriota bacterium]
MTYDSLKKKVRNIPDYPKPGIVFRDITTLLRDRGAFREVQNIFIERYRDRPIDLIAGIEARGFIFGGALANALNVGFIPMRKKGKLPWKTIHQTYTLEYGEDQIHMHEDAITPGQKVLIVDDLLATGGTLEAAARLVKKAKGEVFGVACVIELDFLAGRKRLEGLDVFSIIHYDSE